MKSINKSINHICCHYEHTILLVLLVTLLKEYFSKKPFIESTLKDITDKKQTINYQYLGDLLLINT